jgi:hypothetical protein
VQTKLKPAPVKFPNGGGLSAMANKPRESQRLEVEAMEAKHKAELAKLKEKHANENKPAVKPTAKPAKNG